MPVETAAHAGFCMGVRRAVEKAEVAARDGVPSCTLGELIHNPATVRRLAELGLAPVETPEEPMPDLDTATPITGPEDLFPEPIPEEEAMNTAVEGPARTLRGAIQQKDTTAIIRLLRMQKESCVALTVNKICRDYLEQDLNYRDPNTADAAEIRLFFEVYNDYLKDAALKILSATGFNDMDTFFRMNTDDVLHEAYYSFIDVVRRNL